MGSAASTVVSFAQRERKTRVLLLQYADASGKVQDTFTAMNVCRSMRLSWLERWQALDEDGSKLLDYEEFVQGCGLEENLWSLRLFNLLDKNFIGCVDFFTFFSSLPWFLVFDRLNTVEVAFRICSRRGGTCDPEHAVLDEKDIRLFVEERTESNVVLDEKGIHLFVEERYPALDRKHALHRAMEILEHMDDNCSGGVSFDEFEKFCDVNPVFLSAVHGIVTTMRRAFFGEQFWRDFTSSARRFDEATQKEIFRSPQASGISPDADPTTNGPTAAAVTRRVKAATKRKLENGPNLAERAKETRETLRRVASDSELAKIATSQMGKLKTSVSSKNITEGMASMQLWTRTVKPAEVQQSLRIAGRRAKERLERSAREISHAGDKKLQVSTKKKPKFTAPTLTRAFMGRFFSNLPHKLPDAETAKKTGKRVTNVTIQGGHRALQALKRAAKVIMGQHIKMAPPRRRLHEESANVTAQLDTFSKGKDESRHSVFEEDVVDEASIEDEGGFVDRKVLWEILTGAAAEAGVTHEVARLSAMAEQFHAHLDTATARLEAKRTAQGYDFSSDFPNLWGASQKRGIHDATLNKHRRQRRSSASKRTAKLYMHCVGFWQECVPGRAKLAVAFNRWRLHTCDAGLESVSSTVSIGIDSSVTDADTLGGGGTLPRNAQTLKEMWEEAGGANAELDLHTMILKKASADRPLPQELCDIYEGEMLERINRRQAENNVPILPTPFLYQE